MANKLYQRKTLMRSTGAQIQLLVDYMTTHKEFANSAGQYSGVMGQVKANEEWESLRTTLREYGGDKSVAQWRQSWRDLKRKARNIIKDSEQGQIPIVTDIIYKVIQTIAPPGQECTVQVQDTNTSLVVEDIDWEMENENSILVNNEIEDDFKNSPNNEADNDRSSEAEAEDDDNKDTDCLVQVLVPLPQTKQEQVTASKNLQNDPLQAPGVGIPRPPRLTARPRRRSPTASQSPPTFRRRLRTPVRDKRAPSIDARRRQMLISRRRKQNMLHQASNDFVALEHARLKMEEERDRRLHDREMERLKLELQRIEVQRNHNELLQHVVTIAQNAYELLQRHLQ